MLSWKLDLSAEAFSFNNPFSDRKSDVTLTKESAKSKKCKKGKIRVK